MTSSLRRRYPMSIAPEEFLPISMVPWMDGADCRSIGRRAGESPPHDMPNTNSPLRHSDPLYWTPRGILWVQPWPGARCAVTATQNFAPGGPWRDPASSARHPTATARRPQTRRGDQPCAFPDAVREQHRAWTQGHFVLQCYKELAQHHGHMELTRDVMLGQGPAS